jgi:hypothetical protein
MKPRSLLVLCLLTLAIAAQAPPAVARAPVPPRLFLEDEFPGAVATFKLADDNGYLIHFGAYSERGDGKGKIGVSVIGKDGAAFYGAPAIVSDAFVKADLGPFGKVDLALRPSGREKTVSIKCTRDQEYTYEPGTYEGIVEFEGEDGYVGGRATRLPLLPPVTSFCGGGSGYGESISSREHGARLRGVSYSQGRRLKFQVNKNHARARTFFKAELGERREGITIYRTWEGVAPAASFRFDPKLRTARLSPSAPFSGSASLTRNPDSVFPNWTGDLKLDFPGHTDVPMAGAGVYVTLVHARFNCGGNGEITVGLRSRCGL